MRVRNKEIRSRRHRKDQVVKAAARVLREKFGDKKANPTAPKAKTAAPKKAAAKPASERKTAH